MQVIFYLQLVEIKKYIYIHTWIDLHKLIRNSKTIFFPLPFSRLPCTTNALRKKGAQLVRQNDCSIWPTLVLLRCLHSISRGESHPFLEYSL